MKEIYSMAPAIVRKNCPNIPYWNSSPYGGLHPNGRESGDRHHWHDCMMNDEMQRRITPEEYDRANAKFVSEYGYVGPAKRSSIEKYLAGAPFQIDGEVWQHHNNTFEKDTVLEGIRYHYCDTEQLDIDNYLLYAGLCQGVMYAYSLEAFRYNLECFGGLFWMYNDCWGEIGWTIIDYYLIRKISYYFVKRALAHVKFIMREENGLIKSVGINDTQNEMKVMVEYGYVSWDGGTRNTKSKEMILAPHSRDVILTFQKGAFDETKGTYFIRCIGAGDIPTALLRTGTFRKMNIAPAEVTVEAPVRKEGNVYFNVSSKSFAYGVHFKLPDEIRLSDEYFDLLPGERRNVVLYDIPDTFSLQGIKAYCINYR